MDSFLREATVLRSVNYLNHSGKLINSLLFRISDSFIFTCLGFPQMLMSAYNEDICILVEDLLGVNLETLRKRHARLSLAVVCSVGIQLVSLKPDFEVKPPGKPARVRLHSQGHQASKHPAGRRQA